MTDTVELLGGRVGEMAPSPLEVLPPRDEVITTEEARAFKDALEEVDTLAEVAIEEMPGKPRGLTDIGVSHQPKP